MHPRNKIIQETPNALNLVKEWKQAKNKIVFTNGCFDLVHQGHIDYLYKAREQGDRLVIGLNSDSSVKRLKGSSRPINDWHSRAMVLAAFYFTDLIVAFDEDTPEKLIENITPDILIKGGDYNMSNIVGADYVIHSGGKVLTIPFLTGFSSSTIIERIKKEN